MNEEKPSIVVEEYLQEIYLLQSIETPVKATHLATRIQSSPSTVHATLSRMQRDLLIQVDHKKNITLTGEGEAQAKDLVIRHHLAETFLCNTLGIPWYQVHKHAHQLEHAMTPLVVEKLAQFLNHPATCPHGVPTQGHSDPALQQSIPLDQTATGMQIKIVMINEYLEESEDLLKYLHEKSVVPGSEHTIIEILKATNSVTLDSETGQVTLPFDIAKNIRIEPVTSNTTS
ncbi:MAG: metal-dependent transcriptional regulator [SAR324 cluster bacterium]|nr:metal-dependent transcriptional regulator [SAR324 cluster bacterium]